MWLWLDTEGVPTGVPNSAPGSNSTEDVLCLLFGVSSSIDLSRFAVLGSGVRLMLDVEQDGEIDDMVVVVVVGGCSWWL